MYKRWLCVVLFVMAFTKAGISQVFFWDNTTKKPISGANIYLNDGRLIGFTDKNGAIQLLSNASFIADSVLQLKVQHISYQEKRVSADLSSSEIFLMHPRALLIDAIEVKLKEEADVVVLKGYYRSLETFDSKRKYFSDGILEVFIPRNKGRVRYRYLQRRVFRDSLVTADYKSRMGPFFQLPRVPKFSSKKLADILQDYTLEQSNQPNLRLFKNGEEVGTLSISDREDLIGETQLYRDLVLPDSIIKEKIFRIEAHTYKELDLVTYSSTDLRNIGPNDITSVYQNIVASIKRRKEFGHIPFESLNEFYVMERSSISLKEYKDFKRLLIRDIYKMPEKSDFTERYWEELDRFEIPLTAFDLNDTFDSELKLIR